MNIVVYDWIKEEYRHVILEDFEKRLKSINIDLDEKDVLLKDVENRLFDINDNTIIGTIKKDSFIQCKPFRRYDDKVCCSLSVIL